MTDDMRKSIVKPAADGAKDSRTHRLLAAIGILAVLFFVLAVILFYVRSTTLQSQVDDLAANAAAQHAAAQTLASQVSSLGGTPAVSPPPGPTGAAGPAGPAGANGRGIAGTSISGGHLYITYSDGVTEDKGVVVAAAGAKGGDGRGITGANATSGHLVLSYSDGSTSDAGAVVGPQGATGATGTSGRGIKSVSTAGGELQVTYDDGTTMNAGPLPAGPPGPSGPPGAQGPAGSPPASWTWTDELGRHYNCARDAGSPDSAPTYSCTTASPSSTTAAARTRTSGR